MSRLSEKEIQEIMEEYKDAPMVNPDKIYPPLPPVQNVTPLVRIPEPMSFTEKIGGTEYTVNAHFRKDGRDLLATLTDIFRRSAQGYGFYDENWDDDNGEYRQRKNYRFKALKFMGRCGTLYLHFTIPCLLSERRTL